MPEPLAPADALHLLENSLRIIVHDVLSRADRLGPTWRDQAFTATQVRDWAKAERAWGRANPTLAPFVDATGLAFAYYNDLVDAVEKQWPLMSAELGGDGDIVALLRLLKAARRDVAHSRPLVPYQVELLSGAARHVAGMAAQMMSERDDSGLFYPVMTEARDDRGLSLSLSKYRTTDGGRVLHPGDHVAFRVVGVDPQGRPLTWSAFPGGGAERRTTTTAASGETVELTWAVTEDDIKEMCFVIIDVKSSGRFHREGEVDQRIAVHYKVRPLPEGLDASGGAR